MEKIIMNTIDEALSIKTKKAKEEIENDKSSDKELLLEIQSAKGDTEIALKIAQDLHCSNIAIRTHADGEMDTAGTILAAIGEPGHRKAKPGAKFRCTDGEPYDKDAKLDDLDSKDQAVYDALSELTGKPKKILEKILSAEEISSTSAIRCGIIDETDGFKSKYKNKIEPKKGSSNTNTENLNDTKDENQNVETSNSDQSQQPTKRGRRIKN
ncbi:MAG: ATP-dependent Clp protease proteolytic subunit [Bacteroidetes bacterium]|nr:ATP-dependent Clp protease proteolytic subunit [Bacteroidota bacterium]